LNDGWVDFMVGWSIVGRGGGRKRVDGNMKR